MRVPKSVIVLAGLMALVLLNGCSRPPIEFPYADERYTYPDAALGAARVHLGQVRDVRPPEQRQGEGRFLGITYPADRRWAAPVAQLYREALTRDLVQTSLCELTALPAQADYVLEAEIESFHVRMTRSAMSYLLPPAAGLVGGFALGDDTGSSLRRAAVLSVVAFGALPMPADQHAEVQVRLLLRDRAGEVVWEQTCLGEVDDRVGEAVTARRDKLFAERYLPQAVKRANACLLGQLRQYLVSN
ncbi:MAG TPA: hypothetical protein P5571_03545 [Candidatus Krumholzibacteria bacterium]|nr:hypothetical protein [Candidatus Krumholzibacteria bacterium]HRX50414.1 hypothetical protein [Candidatus Krumholzibacteria bacterium]